MRPVAIDDLITAIGGVPQGLTKRSETILRIEIDSRNVQPGDLFWALKGNTHDGHRFVQHAFDNGAVAAVIEPGEFPCEETIEVADTLEALWDFARWYRAQFDTLVIGVTGSVGKTTTRRMIRSVLETRFHGIESPHNFNNQFGVPLSLLNLDEEHDFAVIELGASRSGEIGQLAGIACPEIGVITSIGPSHLDEFETFENITNTKAELIETISDQGFAVLNGDDRNIRKIAQRANCPLVLVGEKKHNDLIASDIQVENGELRFRIDGSEFLVHAVGRHHVTAALIAIAIGRQVDLSEEEIRRGLEAYSSQPGRCHVQQIGPWTVIDDTYNANPLSMSAACRLLGDWNTNGKKILLAGDMLALGTWSEDFHHLLGEEATRSKIDRIIAYGSQASVVTTSAKKHGMDAGCLGVTRNQEIVMMLLDLWLQPGDVILIKGSRGMKMESFLPKIEQLANQYHVEVDNVEEKPRKVA